MQEIATRLIVYKNYFSYKKIIDYTNSNQKNLSSQQVLRKKCNMLRLKELLTFSKIQPITLAFIVTTEGNLTGTRDIVNGNI